MTLPPHAGVPTGKAQAAPATVQGVDHVQWPIPVGSAARARAFYEGLLGLAEVRDPLLDKPGTLRFALGAQRLDLSEGRYTGVAPQAHIALRVHNLRRLTEALYAAGLRVDAAPLPDLEQRIYVEDPFGNRLELIEPIAGQSDTLDGHRAAELHHAV